MGLPIVTFNMLGMVLLMLIFGIDANNPEGISMLVGSSFGAILSALLHSLEAASTQKQLTSMQI